jgi:hypothetical protein
MNIHLGYEVGTGKAIEIPLRHMAVCGQTQEAGKTTALEALISRSGLRAIAFITKRGESGFSQGRRILPYFQERADWEFIESILEATMKQRMKFERAWIVKACKGAHGLAGVQRNVSDLMERSKRSMDKDIFMLLGEYLSKVVPLVRSLPKTPSVDLAPGLNVMDVREYPEELQLLVISSSIRWIYQHAQDVITIIPEAWKFVPQGRNTPVKVEVRKLAREGAALKNYIWIDSQDMAGVEKEILRAAAVWLLGVQREPNEIRRSLDAIPKGVKRPKEGDIPQLKLGEFFACWVTNVHKTYVQPTWINAADAIGIATGRIAHSAVRTINAVCQAPLEPTIGDVRTAYPPHDDLPPGHAPKVAHVVYEPPGMFLKPDGEAYGNSNSEANEDDMYKPLYEKAQREIEALRARIVELENKTLPAPFVAEPEPNKPMVPLNGQTFPRTDDADSIYQHIKERLAKEAPGILATIAHSKPEIEVRVERRTIKMDSSNAKGRIAVLIADGALSSGKRPSEIIAAITERGMGITPSPRVSEALKELVELGFLLPADGSGRYRAVEGMRVNIVE